MIAQSFLGVDVCKTKLDVTHSSVADSIERVIADLEQAIAEVKVQIKCTIDGDPHLKQRGFARHDSRTG